jgi:hypothetical protein
MGMGITWRGEGEDEERLSPEEFVKDFFPNGLAEPQNLPNTNYNLPPLEWLKRNFDTKSAAIRYLVSKGIPTKIIAKHLGILYPHARNVSITPLKRGPNEPWIPKCERQPHVTNQPMLQPKIKGDSTL